MLAGSLPGLMEPMVAPAPESHASHRAQQQQQQQPFVVNSHLVSLSIVADARFKYAPLKVDLSAPIELTFRHLTPTTATAQENRCAYWDTGVR